MKKLGILLATPPDHKNRITVVNLVRTALQGGIITYLYLIDEGVDHATDPEINALVHAGLHLFVCSLGAQRRGLLQGTMATPAGLVVLSDMIQGCDRFLPFT